MTVRFNPPPGWPRPPADWTPPDGWQPDPSWPVPPADWQWWLTDDPATPPPVTATVPALQPQGRHSVPPTVPAVADPVDANTPTEQDALRTRIAELERQLAEAKASGDRIDLDDERVLQDAGIYRYHHPLENAAAYKDRLTDLQARTTDILKNGRPVQAADLFTFDGSLAKGRRMVADLSKLMLRAYNAEADNCVRSLRAGNVTAAKKRLESAVTAIQRLGSIMEMRIDPGYHSLRIEELELTADYQMKIQEERERARDEREQLREQRRAEQELAAERERLDKERTHYQTALAQLRAQGDGTAGAQLEARLADIEQAIAQNDYRIANIRAGYVYVISNVGAFGPNVVKVGLTRRLEPRDRVRELGDASVPFPYDIHALFFSEDAVTLEAELHRALAGQRVNFVNPRREFFFATPSRVRELLLDKVGGMLEFVEHPEALEYLQSRGQWPSEKITSS